MSRVTPAQTSFNGGSISKRLRARRDQSLYAIAVGEMVGFAPLVEGPAEAMPGTLHVAQEVGPCRLFRFEYNTTQGHVLAMSNALVRIYTNDALLTDEADAPVTVASPYAYAEVLKLKTHQSYDVLYCFLGTKQTRQFVRNDATDFAFELLELENGPFDPRNKDKTLRVSASALTGDVTLEATADLFAATDVGSLFKLEAEDFGDVTAWEPYITVTAGQLLTNNERVYRVIGGNGATFRTGGLAPIHTEGVEWDGIAKGTDLNDKPAAGVQLEYVHDRIGIVRITGFTDAQHVSATVLRHLPFSSVSGGYTYEGGYWDPEFGVYVPPAEAVTYSYGTWRWSFGAFSDTRGWPQCGCVWNGRLCLAKGTTLYCSVAEDLTDFSTLNELGEISADMAVTRTIADPNAIEHLVPGDKTLLVLNASGTFALGPESVASAFGPANAQCPRQNSAGSGAPMPVDLDARTLHVDRSGRRIYQVEFDPGRGVEQPDDLTRYARHMGTARFTALAPQQHPFNHVWALRGDAALACAAYLPEEEVLGFAERRMAPGVSARSLTWITDPAGEFDQVWLAVERLGGWHVLRMAPWRHDAESDLTGCMLDMAAEYDGAPETDFVLAHLPNTSCAAVADGRLHRFVTDGAGNFTLPAASRVVAGLEFPAWLESLPFEAGGDNGTAMGRKARFGRAWIMLEDGRGLQFGAPADSEQAGDMTPVEGLEASLYDPDTGAEDPSTGFRFREVTGAHTRWPRLRAERLAPFQSTILAWGGELNMESL